MKIKVPPLNSSFFTASLRTKLIFAFFIPMLIILTITSIIHVLKEQVEWHEATNQNSVAMTELILRGMYHGMLDNNSRIVTRVINNFGQQEHVQRIWIINNEGEVKYSSVETEIGTTMFFTESGCQDCHKYVAAERPQTVRLADNKNILRVVAPINNNEECRECHSDGKPHLGVLIIDQSLDSVNTHLREDTILNILIGFFSLGIIAFIAYLLIKWLIERRIEVLANSITQYASGDFSVRVPIEWRTEDEVTRLAAQFNYMADMIDKHNKEQREIIVARQQAIMEERHRIGRELHDGIAQLLAYMTTKITAVRLLLEQRKSKLANEQLDQLEEVINRERIDIRSTIAGLKLISTQNNSSLVENVGELAEICQSLCEIPIRVTIDSSLEQFHTKPELQFQIIRIVQEAINNASKHAKATHVTISLGKENDMLTITVEDNGIGFNPWKRSNWQPPHYGLNSMSERAEKIGASFKVQSSPGEGTRITIQMKVPKKI